MTPVYIATDNDYSFGEINNYLKVAPEIYYTADNAGRGFTVLNFLSKEMEEELEDLGGTIVGSEDKNW